MTLVLNDVLARCGGKVADDDKVIKVIKIRSLGTDSVF